MNLATIFDGPVPASANPGVDPGAPVTVWTPTKSGVYAVMLSAPDEAGAPFAFAGEVTVDMGALVPGIQSGLEFAGSLTDEFQPVALTGASLQLETTRGAAVRAVVRVGLVASPEGQNEDDMVVPLDELKRGVGIELADVSEDENLVALEAQAAAWLEEKVGRRFHAPAQRVEYVKGNGTPTLFLWGNIEDGEVTVSERPTSGGGWEALEDPEEVFEIRPSARVQKLERIDGSVWSRGGEYKVTWNDGYTVAPKDIKALIIEAVKLQRDAMLSGSAAAAEGVIKSETIGDYSYTLDLSAAAVALNSSSLTANISTDTINRWRRVIA